MSDDRRDFLRHTLATLAYRGGKAIREAPEGFETFSAGPGVRTPGQILAHIGDLLDWALSQANGAQKWTDSPAVSWVEGSNRFYASLAALDGRLDKGDALGFPEGQIFQGAIADALTHVGQLNILRRLAGGPIKGENYFRAEIRAGRVGPDQTPPRREF